MGRLAASRRSALTQEHRRERSVRSCPLSPPWLQPSSRSPASPEELSPFPAIIGGAGLGIGALKLGLGGISGALSAYTTEQKAAAKATGGASGAASGAASSALQNAQTIRSAANSVAQARETLANAEQSATDSVRQANEQLRSSASPSLTPNSMSSRRSKPSSTPVNRPPISSRISIIKSLTDFVDPAGSAGHRQRSSERHRNGPGLGCDVAGSGGGAARLRPGRPTAEGPAGSAGSATTIRRCGQRRRRRWLSAGRHGSASAPRCDQ